MQFNFATWSMWCVQDLQDEVAKESEELQRLQAQRQKVQQALEELDQQRDSLEEQLTHIRQQTNQETQLVGSVEVWLVDQLKVVTFKHTPESFVTQTPLSQISSLEMQHEEQEQRICHYEEELVQAREELLALQEESKRLQEKVQAAQEQLTPLQESVRDSFTQVVQVGLYEWNGTDHKCQVCFSQLSSVSFFFFLLSGAAETEWAQRRREVSNCTAELEEGSGG